jgi:hypothetical protein
MILCFALGIANIFTFRIFIIIICALTLYVAPALPERSFPPF